MTLKPFWNSQCNEISKKLWFPENIDDLTTHENFKFWLNKKVNPENNILQEISTIPLKITPVKQDNNVLKTIKVRIYPTKEQKIILKQWFGTSRYLYNKTLNYINETKCKKNFMELRNKFVTYKVFYKICKICNNTNKTNKKIKICNFCKEESIFETKKLVNEDIKDWELQVPKEIRENTVRDLIKAYSTTFSNLKSGNITHFKMRFRKKNSNQSIVINKKSIKYNNGNFIIYPKFLGKLKVGKRSKKDYLINNETRMVYDGIHYYLCILKPFNKQEINDRKDIVILDPGLRTFLTGYSQQEVFKISRNPEILKKFRTKLDLLISLRTKKKKVKKKIIRQRNKIKNLIDDLHWKAINYLTKNYKTILLPQFESQKMMGKNRKVNRDFNNLKHYQFKIRLLHKIREIPDTKVYIVTEEFTSKTCSNCGVIKQNLGSSKVLECISCGKSIDRDINGARNIFIKNVLL